MPRYDNRCPCGAEFESTQPMADPPGADCPACGARAERLITSATPAVFRGSGFYETDYKKRSPGRPSERGVVERF